MMPEASIIGRISRPRRLRCATIALTAFAACSGRVAAENAESQEVRSYCANVAAAATDARFAWQTAQLKELEGRLKERIKELDAKQTELKTWIEKRQTIEKQANDKLVGIYAKMRPETAATQISTLSDDMAAAVLGQLNPRQASAIFNEIVPDKAAKLAGMIAGVQSAEDKKL